MQPVAHVQVLDVSQLEPPAPMHRVLAALPDLPRGHCLCMLHRREPYPLYPILTERGYRHLTVAGTDTSFEIFIWREDDSEAAEVAARATAKPGP